MTQGKANPRCFPGMYRPASAWSIESVFATSFGRGGSFQPCIEPAPPAVGSLARETDAARHGVACVRRVVLSDIWPAVHKAFTTATSP